VIRRVPHGPLAEWAGACLRAVGVPAEDAKTVADALVQTSLWGIDSHGILRLTHYLTRLSNGSIVADAMPVVTRSGPVTAQMDGRDGLGIAHAVRAMEVAIGMAREAGIGIVGVGNSSHCGAMGLYTRAAARQGFIGIGMTHASSIVVPHGGRQRYFGTNPISFAFAREGGEPVCLDMATSQVAWNKILNARIEGQALEPGLAVDAAGEPTTDPQAAEAAIPLGGPTYGYKGYGLALAIELLCGPLNGMTFGPRVTGMYDELEKPRRIGHFLMALDPRRFAGGAMLEATVDEMVADLKTRGEILFPGEPELREERVRRAEGIPVEPVACADMLAWSERLRVSPPASLAASG
jgi:ureidoglycolate dehydrogenase (NAD+)